MSAEIKLLVELWPIILSLAAVIVWQVRLEGKVGHVEKSIAHTDKDVEALEEIGRSINEQLSKVRASLGRVEGALKINNHD